MVVVFILSLIGTWAFLGLDKPSLSFLSCGVAIASFIAVAINYI